MVVKLPPSGCTAIGTAMPIDMDGGRATITDLLGTPATSTGVG
jgi:hypothetical protein